MVSQILVAMENHPGAELTVLHVVGTPSAMMGTAIGLALSENIEEDTREAAKVVLDRAHEIASEFDQIIETDVAFGHPARAIVNRAEAFDCVVLGTHGGSLADRLFAGNVAETVFRRSPVPVTVVR